MDDYIIRDIPALIKTPRLHIRVARAHDGIKVNEAIKESFNQLHPWMPWAQELPSPEESEHFVRQSQAEWIMRKSLTMLIFDTTETELIGCTGFNDIDWSVPRLAIGYWANSRFSGHGYITEAVNALTQFGFDELQAARVEIRCDADNLKSRKIPERLGFIEEAFLKSFARRNSGELAGTVQYVRFNQQGLPELEVSWQ
jgi:RimJ/RimL family protein N-acetyltransferase